MTVSTLIPIILIGGYSAKRASIAVESKITHYVQQIVVQINQNISSFLESFSYLTDELMISERVHYGLINYDDLDVKAMGDIRKDINATLNERFTILDKVTSIEVFTLSEKLLYSFGYYSEAYPWRKQLEQAKEAGGKSIWSSLYFKGRNNIVISRQLNDLNLEGEAKGYLILTLDEEQLKYQYSQVDLGMGSILFVVDSKGNIISSNADYMSLREIDRRRLSKEFNSSHGTYKDESGNLLVFKSIKNTDWYTVAFISSSYINSEINMISKNIAMMAGLAGIICLILSIIIGTSIIRPMDRLVQSIRKVEQGNFDAVSNNEVFYPDELGYVEEQFNTMQIEIKNLLLTIECQEERKRQAEIQALQAQINPHFLFNTLNTLKWLAMINQSKTMEEGLGALAHLLRHTIVDRNEEVTLLEEIENLEAYITIQRIRYGDTFSFEYFIDDALMSCKMPKFILQPLVENAIIHGLDGVEDGSLVIEGIQREGDVIIRIVDNGKGFKEKESIDKCNKFTSIGISNVRERIQLSYGRDYGLELSSELDKGTVVEIIIPFNE